LLSIAEDYPIVLTGAAGEVNSAALNGFDISTVKRESNLLSLSYQYPEKLLETRMACSLRSSP
jgi:hypothetical protein